MIPERKRWLMRGVKLLTTLAVFFFVGWQFKRDLEELRPREESKQGFEIDWPSVRFGDLPIDLPWLAASAALYLLGIFPSAWFWRHLQFKFGYPIPAYAAFRAHYIGQLGKYVPGKALAIAIRSALVHPFGVPYGVSIIATFYEVFTGMAAGAIVAALVYMVELPGEVQLTIHPFWLGLGLIAVCGVPLLPRVFNLLIAKLTAKIAAVQLYRLPPLRFGTLAAGLATSAVGWWLQGLSLWAMLQAVVPEPPALSWSWFAQCTAAIAFANVAGFVSGIPGGLGVREYLLKLLLVSAGARKYIAAAIILLRLACIAAEIVFALCTYWLKPAGVRREPAGSEPK